MWWIIVLLRKTKFMVYFVVLYFSFRRLHYTESFYYLIFVLLSIAKKSIILFVIIFIFSSSLPVFITCDEHMHVEWRRWNDLSQKYFVDSTLNQMVHYLVLFEQFCNLSNGSDQLELWPACMQLILCVLSIYTCVVLVCIFFTHCSPCMPFVVTMK